MALLDTLLLRGQSRCELCSQTNSLSVYEIPPKNHVDAQTSLMACEICITQMNDPEKIDPHHWRCLNESMWSEHQAVRVMAYRMLHQLKSEPWAQELLEQLYLDDSVLEFARAALLADDETDSTSPTLDSNGSILAAGDSVSLIKDLVVKGAGFTAKRGTLVKNISLTSNPKHIEGKVNGIQIVLIAEYLKKI